MQEWKKCYVTECQQNWLFFLFVVNKGCIGVPTRNHAANFLHFLSLRSSLLRLLCLYCIISEFRLSISARVVLADKTTQKTLYTKLIFRTRHYHSLSSSIFCHILLSINIGFLLEQYLSGTLFQKPASTRIPSPHSRRSSVTRPERCAHPPSSWYAKVVWRLLN